MHCRGALCALFALLLPLLCRADGSAPARWFVVTSGSLAGARIGAHRGGWVSPESNLATGSRGGIVLAPHGWTYHDAAAGSAAVTPLDDLPEHVRLLSHALSTLRAAALFGAADAGPELSGAGDELATAARIWREASPAPDADAWEAQADLDALSATVRQAVAAADAGALRDVIPALHRVAAVALAGPRVDITVTVSPTTLDFGEVEIGRTRVQPIGVSTDSISEITVGVDTTGLAAPFSASGGATLYLSKGAGSSSTITFSPTAAGNFTGQIVYTHPALPGGRTIVQVKGKGTPPTLLASPRPLDFGKVHLKSFKTLSLSVTNASSNKADITVKASLKKPFSSEALSHLVGSYDPNETQTLNVSFSPKKVGKYSGLIRLFSSQSAPVDVEVTGEGVGDISVSSSAVDFGSVDVNTTATQQLAVTNQTDQPVTISITGAALPFAVPAPPTTIPANGTVNVNVTYAPTKAGSDTDRLNVESTGSGGKFSVPVSLTGSAVQETLQGLKVSRKDINFGTVPHGQLVQETFTITNTGTAATSVTVDRGALPTDVFNVLAGGGFTLQPNEVHTVTVTFDANRACKHKGKIVVYANEGSATVTVEAIAQ